jgi:hypothetical protein
MTSTNKKPKPTEVPTSPKRGLAPKKAAASKARRARRLPPSPTTSPAKIRKRDQLASLLLRDEGATIEQMVTGLGWLPHTARAALTGLKKLGYAIDSDKIDGLRTYRAAAPE